MNVKLKKTFTFYTGLVYDNEFAINVYDVTLHMTTVSNDPDQHNIAYERMNYWINEVLHESVLIGADSDKLDAYRATGQRLIVFPQGPVDQLAGVMLYLKLNAIAENRIIVTDVELSSTFGDEVVYLHNSAEDIGPMSVDGWWMDSKPHWADVKKKKSANKVISLDRMPEWSDLDLQWEEHSDKENNTVVFGEFPKNEH